MARAIRPVFQVITTGAPDQSIAVRRDGITSETISRHRGQIKVSMWRNPRTGKDHFHIWQHTGEITEEVAYGILGEPAVRSAPGPGVRR